MYSSVTPKAEGIEACLLYRDEVNREKFII
jgi:hypothetical protein